MTNLLSEMSANVLFEAAADAMLLVDDSGQIVEANSAALTLLGYSKNQIIGLKVETLIPNRYRHDHVKHRTTFAKKPQKRSMGNGKNLVALTAEGKEVYVDISLSSTTFNNQRFTFIIFHQIDKQVQAEEQLHLAQLATSFGVFDIDLELELVKCDAYTRKLWGFEPDKTITYADFLKAINQHDQTGWQAAIDDVLESNADGEFQADFRLNNAATKAEHWVFTAVKVYKANNHVNRLVGITHDITDRKEFEQKSNAQRTEMEALAKQHVAFQTASAIAHELNQPLTALSAYSEVALHELEDERVNFKKMNECLSKSVAQAQRAGKSLHELLEYLQQRKISAEDFDINEAIKTALHIVQDNGYGDFHSTVELEPNIPNVFANQVQIQKVLVNLLRNGLEASQKIGLDMTKIYVYIKTEADLNMALVIVKDNGPGLDKETAKKLFEPFFTTKPTGIGMGLTVSRALVEANGGRLWYNGDNKNGAEFHFTLPFAQNNG